MDAKCSKCGAVLVSGKNWAREKFHDRRCNDCVNAYQRDYFKRYRLTPNGRKHAQRSGQRRTERFLGQQVNGVRVMVKAPGKRLRTEQCEMCERPVRKPSAAITAQETGYVSRLVYHHWDDSDYSLGIWVCQRCHNVCHVVEDGTLMQKYTDLKATMETTK